MSQTTTAWYGVTGVNYSTTMTSVSTRDHYLLHATNRRSREVRADGPQTIEDIINAGIFKIPKSDPETALLADQRNTSSLAVVDAMDMLRRRYVIYDQHLAMLEEAKVAAANMLNLPGTPGHFVTFEQRERFHDLLKDIYQEVREERLSLWRDVSRLRQSFPEVVLAYLSAFRKSQIVGDLFGGDTT